MTRYGEQFPTGPYGRQPHPGIQPGSAPVRARSDSIGQEGASRKRRGRWFSFMPAIIGIALLVGISAAGFYFADRYHWIDLSSFHSKPEANSARSAGKTMTIFSGRASELRSAPGNTIQKDPSDPSIAWIRSSLKAAKSKGATDGVSVNVSNALTGDIQGKRIRVTVSAKRGGKDVQSPFAIAYSTGSAGNSGWLVFEPSNEFNDFSFNYVVPRAGGGLNHFVGIWSDIAGRGAPLAVSSVTITILP